MGFRWADIGVAILVVAVGLLALLALTHAAVEGPALWFLTVCAAGAAILSGLGIARLARRWELRLEQLRGWVNLIAGDSESVRRDVASNTDAVDRVQLAVIDMLGMRLDQQAAIYRRFEDVLNALPDGVVAVTQEGLISLVNAAGRPLFGADGSVIGKSIFETLSRHSLDDALRLAGEAGRPVAVDLKTVWSDTLHATVAGIGSDGSALLRFPAREAATVRLEHDLSLHDRPHQPVAATQKTALAELPALVLDTETTGLEVARDRVISIGAVRAQGTRLFRTAALNLLVNPGRSIPNRTIAIHGISNAMVAEAPAFAAIADRVSESTRGLVLIGHHIGFDVGMLQHEMRLCGREWSPVAALDIMLLYSGIFPDRRALTLDEMAADMGVPVIGRHSALGDALTTAEIYVRLVAGLAARGIVTLGDALAFQRDAAGRLNANAGGQRWGSV